MRLISMDGHIDVPYEQVALAIAPEDIEGKTHFFIKAFHGENYYVLGDYSKLGAAEYVIASVVDNKNEKMKYYCFPTNAKALHRSGINNLVYGDPEKILLGIMLNDSEIFSKCCYYLTADDFSTKIRGFANKVFGGVVEILDEDIIKSEIGDCATKHYVFGDYAINEFIRETIKNMLERRYQGGYASCCNGEEGFFLETERKLKELVRENFISGERMITDECGY